jgi:hypothetical protein
MHGKGLVENINEMGNKMVYKPITDRIFDKAWNKMFRTLSIRSKTANTKMIVNSVLDNDCGVVEVCGAILDDLRGLNYG